MPHQEASRQPFRGLTPDRAGRVEKDEISGAQIDAKRDTGDVRLTRSAARGRGAAHGSEAKRKGPGDAGAPPETVSCLGLAATAIGAAAAQESPKPTHDKSPVQTVHEEQLTERIP